MIIKDLSTEFVLIPCLPNVVLRALPTSFSHSKIVRCITSGEISLTGASANASNMLSSIGNAQAAGTMAAGNALAGGLNSISNYAMLYSLKNPNSIMNTGSDIRMKENIKTIGWLPNGLPVYSYEYKPEFKDDEYCGHGRYVGVMAHEVEEIIPDAVVTRQDGYKMVNYAKV